MRACVLAAGLVAASFANSNLPTASEWPLDDRELIAYLKLLYTAALMKWRGVTMAHLEQHNRPGFNQINKLRKYVRTFIIPVNEQLDQHCRLPVPGPGEEDELSVCWDP